MRNFSLLAWGQDHKGSAKAMIQEIFDDNFEIFLSYVIMKTNVVGTC